MLPDPVVLKATQCLGSLFWGADVMQLHMRMRRAGGSGQGKFFLLTPRLHQGDVVGRKEAAAVQLSKRITATRRLRWFRSTALDRAPGNSFVTGGETKKPSEVSNEMLE